jgi:DNA-binding CsgD family transcriptional regulator
MVVVFDFNRKQVQYISDNDLLRHDPIRRKSNMSDCDFFEKIIHPDDISFWKGVHALILNNPNDEKLPVNQIDHFSFLLRIKNSLSSNKRPDYLMIYVKLKLQWEKEQLRYGIYTLSPSVIREQNKQLCVHYNNKDHSEYSFETKKWRYFRFSPLTKRQKEMLVWAKQGFSLKETAEKMNVSDKTIEVMRYKIFGKFGVNTIEQAIQYASNRKLIFHSPVEQSKTTSKED